MSDVQHIEAVAEEEEDETGMCILTRQKNSAFLPS
jgi:hypothetical protein